MLKYNFIDLSTKESALFFIYVIGKLKLNLKLNVQLNYQIFSLLFSSK